MISAIPANLVRPPAPASHRRTGSGGNTRNALAVHRCQAVGRACFRGQGWLRRHSVPAADAEDLTQEVMAVVVRELPGFKHNQHAGAFRSWLRTITVNRLRLLWRSRQARPVATGGSDFLKMLDELEDPN